MRVAWKEHIAMALKGSLALRKFYRAIRKYGPKNFSWSILAWASTKKVLDTKERYWIRKLQTRKNGYNITVGGDGLGWGKDHPCYHNKRMAEKMRLANLGKRYSQEVRLKQSKMRKGRKFSKQWRENIRRARIGKHHTPETKLKISRSKLGTRMSPEARQKMRIANLGKTLSAEHRLKISIANKGRHSSKGTEFKPGHKPFYTRAQ